MHTSKLNLDNGVSALGQACLDDTVETTSQGIVAISRFKRTGQDTHKFRAKFTMVPAQSERHLFAGHPPAHVSAQLIEAAAPSGTNRNLVLTAVRTDLGDVANVIHAMRRILPNHSVGEGHPPALVADTDAGCLSSDAATHASDGAEI